MEKYVSYVKSRSERERMAEKKISGCFTGAYAVHPLPVNKSRYGYRNMYWPVMVPALSWRYRRVMTVIMPLAKHFDIPITNIFGELGGNR